MGEELKAELATAIELANRAGELLMSYRERDLEVSSKSVDRDLVTSADTAAEAIILDGIGAAFPDDGILAEESGNSSNQAEQGRLWCVDPLDGTVNFVQGLPMFSVSIALLEEGVPVMGVVHLPVLSETFTARLGDGCRLNGELVVTSAKAELSTAVLATGFPYRRHLLADNNLENFNRLFLKLRGIRRMGSAAIDLAYVAAGRIDAYWELHLGAWDCAAGVILVREAGGIADTIVPGGDCVHGANIIAGPAVLCEQMREHLLRGRGQDYPPLGDLPVEQAR
ncbi:MAG: inositol monophosphatase [Planctomycetota bacterium]|nr:MAG: inositol monophosphatase [Planctomycetota bacterium]